MLPRVSSDDYKPKSDLSRRVIEDQALTAVNLRQSYLIGTVIRRSEFTSTSLDRCDLDGA